MIGAGAAVLARMGQPSTLDGADCGKVHLARGVRVQLEDVMVLRNVATIGIAYAPVRGQSLVHPDGEYVLDALLGDNGVNRRFILR